LYSFKSENFSKCPFCNSEQRGKTDEDEFEELRKRVDVNDAGAIYILGSYYYHGQLDLQQDHSKAMELFASAAELGYSQAHNNLAKFYHQRGDLKKAKFHGEAAAMAGHEVARCNLAILEWNSGNIEQAVKHWTIAASAGYYQAMHELRLLLEKGVISRESIDPTLKAYNNSCAKMRSEARDAAIINN
jgi:TPR repeat protein